MDITSEAPEDCHDFRYGKCQSDPCWYNHPAEMRPDLAKEVEFQASTEKNEGCLRCLDAGYTVSEYYPPSYVHANMAQCDKKGRDASITDPCSECYHFGGPQCKCTLVDKSQNDILFDRMVQRAREGYTLSRFKQRDEARANGKIPAPMVS
jgi:hypothetical protein